MYFSVKSDSFESVQGPYYELWFYMEDPSSQNCIPYPFFFFIIDFFSIINVDIYIFKIILLININIYNYTNLVN